MTRHGAADQLGDRGESRCVGDRRIALAYAFEQASKGAPPADVPKDRQQLVIEG